MEAKGRITVVTTVVPVEPPVVGVLGTVTGVEVTGVLGTVTGVEVTGVVGTLTGMEGTVTGCIVTTGVGGVPMF